MPVSYALAQVQGTAGTSTYTTLFSTGAAETAVVSSIAICNTASATVTYRIGVMGSAGTPSANEWIVYDNTVPGNDTVFLTIGLTLGNTDFIRVSSSANTCAFSASYALNT
jgi:hypothetical protein